MAFSTRRIGIARELREQGTQLLTHVRSMKQKIDKTGDEDEKKRLEGIACEHVKRARKLASLGKQVLTED